MAGALNVSRTCGNKRHVGPDPGMGGVVYRLAITASLIAVLFAALPAMAVESVGVVTILEGDATAIRGLS
ncbi:MAG TPA: hypothetical protein VGM15_07265, partial [Burkholderiaceae bacterium]